MSITELTRIDKSIDIRAPRERVWRALTDAAELAAWFQVRIDGEIAAGNTVWMTFKPDSDAPQRSHVRIVELAPPERVVWQWHPGEQEPAVDYTREPYTTVTFTLEALDEAGTRLHVAETGFDQVSLARRAKVYADNTQGWTEVVVWLRDHVEAAR